MLARMAITQLAGAKPAKLMVAVAMLTSCMGEANAATDGAFDLQCNSEQGRSFNFRFELQQRRWCFEDCQAVWNIDDLSDARIRLTLRTRDGADYWTIHIDRYTSDFWIVRRGYGNEP